jgi:sigma-B regulation protein RsbU (phosphoserine phosphatase)
MGEIRSGSAVGADYYDFGNDGDDLILALGDVAGKGTGAAILMTLLRAAVRAHWTDGSPGALMPRINRNLRDSVPANRYATLFLGRLTPATGSLRYANAGHHAPILMRAGGEVSRLQEGGTVLGVFEEASFGEGVVSLEPGDLVVIFSDGVAEAVDEAGEPFGGRPLLALLTEHRATPAPEVMRAVLAGLGAHAGGGPGADDWTLIVLKRLPPPDPPATD